MAVSSQAFPGRTEHFCLVVRSKFPRVIISACKALWKLLLLFSVGLEMFFRAYSTKGGQWWMKYSMSPMLRSNCLQALSWAINSRTCTGMLKHTGDVIYISGFTLFHWLPSGSNTLRQWHCYELPTHSGELDTQILHKLKAGSCLSPPQSLDFAEKRKARSTLLCINQTSFPAGSLLKLL